MIECQVPVSQSPTQAQGVNETNDNAGAVVDLITFLKEFVALS